MTGLAVSSYLQLGGRWVPKRARRGGVVRSFKRLRDTAAAATDNSTAIITTNRFLALEALTSRVILLLTTNFSGGG